MIGFYEVYGVLPGSTGFAEPGSTSQNLAEPSRT